MTPPIGALSVGAAPILGRPLSAAEAARFSKYLNILIKWGRTQRLTGSSDPLWIVRELFLDSLLFLKILPPEARRILDLGSGAGLPGIPIKIVKSETDVTLLESRRKRASFLSAVIRELELREIRVVNARLEAAAGQVAHPFDAVVMRCAGRFADLVPKAVGLVVPGGLIVATGPPAKEPLTIGEWVGVAAGEAGPPRRFVVYRKPSSGEPTSGQVRRPPGDP